MPNTARGGGISRKITDAADRKRLKAIAQELEVPEGMGVILRTAGASRTKAEVKRDFEYLLRMWETRARADAEIDRPDPRLRGRLADQARDPRSLQQGHRRSHRRRAKTAYREAKDFMRMLMPSHAKNVQPYRDPQPIFAKSGVEAQLDAMFSNQVTLKSGGYLVINQTEALVAIDVNSGRSTREHNIEDTALRTNLEAADEIARQLRLRDLAGLIVVDFIDMEENRNNRAVERRLKDALKNDRARIQIGRISHFGLLEMSRQRIRTGVLEGSTAPCPHCAGAGMVRSTASIALHVLRVLEDALIKSSAHNITVRTRAEVALYILNQKRANLQRSRAALRRQRHHRGRRQPDRHGLSRDGAWRTGDGRRSSRSFGPSRRARSKRLPLADEEAFGEEISEDEEAEAEGHGDEAEQGEGGRRRRRRRRRRGRDREATGINANAPQPSDEALAAVAQFGGFAERASEDALAEAGGAEDREALSAEEAGAAGRSATGGGGARAVAAMGKLRPLNRCVGPSAKWTHSKRRPNRRAAIGRPMPRQRALPAGSPRRQRRSSVKISPPASRRMWRDRRPRPQLAHTTEQPRPEIAETAFAKSTEEAETESHAGEEPGLATVDPNRPKRTGWWQRAKASVRG